MKTCKDCIDCIWSACVRALVTNRLGCRHHDYSDEWSSHQSAKPTDSPNIGIGIGCKHFIEQPQGNALCICGFIHKIGGVCDDE